MDNHHEMLKAINGLGFLDTTEEMKNTQFYCIKNGVKEIITSQEHKIAQRKNFGKAYFQFNFAGASFDYEGNEYGCEHIKEKQK